jgi:hypothetical protein
MCGRAGFLAAAALLLAAAVALAQEPTKIYGLPIPERVGGLIHGQPVDYETKSPGLGYSLRFSGPPGWIVDVYIYDLGLKTIPDDLESGIVKSQLATAKGDIVELGRRGTYADVTELDGFAIADGGKTGFLCSTFSYLRGERKEMDVTSYLCLTSWSNKFVKMRMTAAKGLLSRTEATDFIKAWIKLLRP